MCNGIIYQKPLKSFIEIHSLVLEELQQGMSILSYNRNGKKKQHKNSFK
jgi:hypothetical protein